MKYLFYIIALIVISGSCKSCNNRNKNTLITEDKRANTSSNEYDALSISKSLLVYLNSFMDEIDSIPNPYNRSVVYSISFLKADLDTVIEIAADISARLVKKESKSEFEIKGICFVNEKPIIIYDYIKGLGCHLYNQQNLLTDQIDKYVLNDQNGSSEAWTFVPPILKLKVINRNSFIVLEEVAH